MVSLKVDMPSEYTAEEKLTVMAQAFLDTLDGRNLRRVLEWVPKTGDIKFVMASRPWWRSRRRKPEPCSLHIKITELEDTA